MPMKPGDVARMHMGLSGGGDMPSTTPAQQILGEQSWPNTDVPDLDPPVPLAMPTPLPEPANEGEIDHLRYLLRAAIYERDADLARLAALQQALERARAKHTSAFEGVNEAERTLRDARLHSRAHLVEAYANNEPVDAVMTEADAKALLDIQIGHERNAQALVEALLAEIADIENGLKQRQRDCQQAAGTLVSRSPEFIGLVQDIYRAYATTYNTNAVEIEPVEPRISLAAAV